MTTITCNHNTAIDQPCFDCRANKDRLIDLSPAGSGMTRVEITCFKPNSYWSDSQLVPAIELPAVLTLLEECDYTYNWQTWWVQLRTMFETTGDDVPEAGEFFSDWEGGSTPLAAYTARSVR